MAWRIDFSEKAKKALAGLDGSEAKRIDKFLNKKLSLLEDPRSIGAPLQGDALGEFWK